MAQSRNVVEGQQSPQAAEEKQNKKMLGVLPLKHITKQHSFVTQYFAIIELGQIRANLDRLGFIEKILRQFLPFCYITLLCLCSF